jgi:hypothetical protein
MIAHTTLNHSSKKYHRQFLICTLVTNWDEYELMKNSFAECGFLPDSTAFLAADNVKENTYDAYNAITSFIQHNDAEYLVIVHQDVRCVDSKQQLLNCLQNLTQLDSKWAICGNAGAMGYHNDMIYITNNGKIVKSNNLPALANSLDENFLVLNSTNPISIAANISGFHLYATDLAITADFLGYTCYVIPFMVNHLSLGNLVELQKNISPFVFTYGLKFRSRYIQTPCTKFFLSNSVAKNKFYNMPFVFFFVKAAQRLKQIKRLLLKGRDYQKSIDIIMQDKKIKTL